MFKAPIVQLKNLMADTYEKGVFITRQKAVQMQILHWNHWI